MRYSALVLFLFLNFAWASAELRLVVILLHESRTPSDDWGEVPHQVGWVLWSAPTPALAFATGTTEPFPNDLLEFRLAETRLNEGTSRRVFRRRNGWLPPPNTLLALSAGRLSELGILNRTVASRAEGAKVLYARVPLAPEPSPFALVAICQEGYVPVREFEDLELMRVALFESDYEWTVLELTRWDYEGLELLIAEGVETWIICLPSEKAPDQSLLTTVVRYSAREPKGLLTSPSTRWTGVVREIDFVPTFMRALSGGWEDGTQGAPIVEARQFDWHRFWNGLLPRTLLQRATTPIGIELPRGALSRVQTHWNLQRELNPMVLRWVGGVALGWTLAGLILYRLHWLPYRLRRVYVVGLSVFGMFPAVAIWHAYCPFELWTGDRQADLSLLASWLVLGWVLMALIMAGIARLGDTTPLWSMAVVVLCVYLLDLFVAGSYGINRSLMHFGLQPSARPFGLNSVDLGVLMGCALLVPAIWMEQKGKTRLGGRGQVGLGLVYGLLIASVGVSLFGAFPRGVLPRAVALGWMALYGVSAIPSPTDWRTLLTQGSTLVAIGIALTMGAIAIDQAQPWQREANLQMFLMENLGLALPTHFPEPLWIVVGWLVVWGVWRFFGGVFAPIRERAPALRWAIVSGGLGVLIAVPLHTQGWLTLAFVSYYLLAMAIEYRIGAKEFRYRYEGNGALKTKKATR